MNNNGLRRLEEIYDEAQRFLVRQIRDKAPNYNADVLIASYLEKTQCTLNLAGIYCNLLESAQNANMKSRVIGGSIGGVERLSSILFEFDPKKVSEHYGKSAEMVLAEIEKVLSPTGQIRKESKSIWPRYCETILSTARFLRQFESGDDFYNWANYFYKDKKSFEALPMILEKKIYGIGYPLACDFLKELGFVNYGKPDVHLRDIFEGIGLCSKNSSDDDIQNAISQLAKVKGVTSYNVDKLFWLIGSGYFYKHTDIGKRGKIGSMKKSFIEQMNSDSISGILTEIVFSGGVEGGGIVLNRRTYCDGVQDFFVDLISIDMNRKDEEIWGKSEILFVSWDEAWNYLVNERFYYMYPLEIHPAYLEFFKKYFKDSERLIIKEMPNWKESVFPNWVKMFNG